MKSVMLDTVVRWKRPLLAAVVGSMLMATGVVAQEPALPGTMIPGNRLFATGNNVFLQFLGGYAAFDIDLLLFDEWGNQLTPVDENGNAFGPVIFNNHDTNPDLPEAFATLGGFTPGDELIFGIFVHNTGYTYFTGPASRNPDNTVHVQFFVTPDGTYRIGVGFEDLFNGGDQDFQDIFFQVHGVTTTVTPEPETWFLMMSGLLGIGVVAVRRRRQEADIRA